MPFPKFSLFKIFDSRGDATIEVSDGGNGWAQVPAGKSRGSLEASVVPYEQAQRSLELLQGAFGGRGFDSVRALDSALKELDGTADKHSLGGNVMLAVSIAFTRALSAKWNISPWRLLRAEFFPEAKDAPPLIFSNLINGGEHANNDLDIQEYMVVAKPAGSISDTIETLIGFYRKLRERLQGARPGAIVLGDEGGYSTDFENNFQPLSTLSSLIDEEELPYRLALDAAASSFYKDGSYTFDKKQLKAAELATIYADYFKRAEKLLSLEDPFEEKDSAAFAALLPLVPEKWIVGDDLTVTNPAHIEERAKEGAINAVIIKPNQIGLVSEACDAILTAQKNNVKTIISHRSGETADCFLVQLAKASGADAVKIGAPARERMLKFNELISLYDSPSI